MLTKIAGCLAIVENDMNLAAQGEHYCGSAQSVKDFIYIIGTNVGAGIFLSGKIHYGAEWFAGGIAYLRLPSVLRRQRSTSAFRNTGPRTKQKAKTGLRQRREPVFV